MPATSPSKPGALLIVAVSGRALAAAARRAGYRPLVADFFCDTDTLELAERAVPLPGDLRRGIDPGGLVPTLRDLAGAERPAAVILGSGFERFPGLVDEVGKHFPLAGNGGAAIARVKDPAGLAADCAGLGIPHPEFTFRPPPDPGNWVAKTAGGAGGTHVRWAGADGAGDGRYFQRFVPGRSLSALFVADRSKAHIVGFSRQWTSPCPTAPFRYGGAVRLRRFDRADAATIGGWLSGLTRRAGLVGLCSADFIQSRGGFTLVEVNPRPGATLDIFDSSEAPLIEAHLAAAAGRPFRLPRFVEAMAATIAYADVPVIRFPAVAWPDWTADRQSAGTRLEPGDPVCTVFASGRSAAATAASARARAAGLSRVWREASA